MRDTNMIFNDGTTATAAGGGVITTDGKSTVLDISKWPAEGAWVQLCVTGTVSGTSPNMAAKIQYSSSSTGNAAVDGPDFTAVTATGTRECRLAHSKLRYAHILYTITGTSPSFGGVYAHVVSGPNRDATA